MTWKFHVHATEQRRLFSRILQILESQMVSIRSFAGEANGGEVSVSFVISSEENKAYRIEALLHWLEDVRRVSFQNRLHP
jgi:acetolactate synthase regulatory subunit